MQKVWLPVELMPVSGIPDLVYRVDIPSSVKAVQKVGIPCNMNKKSPDYGKPYCANHIVYVEDNVDVGIFPKRVLQENVPERDKLMMGMLEHARNDNGQLELKKNADAYFDDIADIGNANAPRKRMIRDVLHQSELRGLPETKMESIRARHSLPINGDR